MTDTDQSLRRSLRIRTVCLVISFLTTVGLLATNQMLLHRSVKCSILLLESPQPTTDVRPDTTT